MRQQARIFISYSRTDAEIALQIRDRLIDLKHEVHMDQSGILPMEDIRERISDMIRGADAVVLVLSAEWLRSRSCQWECKFAHDLNKRFVPIALEDVGKELPPEITRIQYIPYYDGLAFDDVITQARRAFDIDLAWVREHTRLTELSNRWESAGGLVLRGRELREAVKWLKSDHHPDAPPPTEAQKTYIRASRFRETCWRLFYAGLLVGGLIAAGLYLLGADNRHRLRLIAEWNEQLVEIRKHAEYTPELAIRRALSIWLSARAYPADTPEAIYEVLAQAIPEQRLRAEADTGTSPIIGGSFSSDGSLFAAQTAADRSPVIVQPQINALHIIGTDTGTEFPQAALGSTTEFQSPLSNTRGDFLHLYVPGAPNQQTSVPIPDGFKTFALSPDAQIVALGTEGGNVSFASTTGGKSAFDPLEGFGSAIVALQFIDNKNVVMIALERTIHFIDIESGADVTKPINVTRDITAIAVSADHRRISIGMGNALSIWERRSDGPQEILQPTELFSKQFSISALEFSPDDLRLLVAGNDKQARFRLIDVASRRSVWNLDWHDDPLTFARFAPNGQRVVIGTENGNVRFYDTSLGLPTLSGAEHTAVIENSGAGTAAAEGFLNLPIGTGSLELLQSYTAMLTLPGNPVSDQASLSHNRQEITSLAASLDGRLIASATGAGDIFVWDTSTARQIFRLDHINSAPSLRGPQLFADFSPNNASLVSWRGVEDVLTWDIFLPGSTLMESACRLLPYKNGVQEPIPVFTIESSRPEEAVADCNTFSPHYFESAPSDP